MWVGSKKYKDEGVMGWRETLHISHKLQIKLLDWKELLHVYTERESTHTAWNIQHVCTVTCNKSCYGTSPCFASVHKPGCYCLINWGQSSKNSPCKWKKLTATSKPIKHWVLAFLIIISSPGELLVLLDDGVGLALFP